MHLSYGVFLKLASVICFFIMIFLVKISAQNIPIWQIVFFRALFALPIFIIWLVAERKFVSSVKSSNIKGHIWRGIIGTMAMSLHFFGLSVLPLAEVTALSYTTPLLIVILAAIFLKEKVGYFRFGAVAVGLIGVIVILSPKLNNEFKYNFFDIAIIGVVAILLSTICVATVQIIVRKLIRTENTAVIGFYSSFITSFLTIWTISLGWVSPTINELITLVLIGLFGGLGQILLTISYHHAKMSVIAPLAYFSLILSLSVGYFIFKETPSLTMLTGAFIVILAGGIIIWRESVLKIKI